MNRQKGKHMKRRTIALIVVLIAIAAISVFFVQFTALGYRATVPFRSFTEVTPNVYIHNHFTKDKEDTIKMIDEARKRVAEYFGQIKSDPMIIICDDKNTNAKLGGDHDTTTAAIFKAYSYIVISSEYLNVDILAHEMTHAEVHSRIFEGRLGFQSLIPSWFDEGVALQNDYRDLYNEDAWKESTNDGANVVALSDIDTPAKFYAGDTQERRYRYIISKHEVSAWIQRNSVNDLLDLLDKINQGTDFTSLYFDR